MHLPRSFLGPSSAGRLVAAHAGLDSGEVRWDDRFPVLQGGYAPLAP